MYNIPIIFHPRFPKSTKDYFSGDVPFPAHIRELPETEIEVATIQAFGDNFTIPGRTQSPNLIIDFNDDLSLASHFIKWKDDLYLNPIGNVDYKQTQKIEIDPVDIFPQIEVGELYEINIYGAFPVNVIYEKAESDIGTCQVEMAFDYFDQELISIIEEFFKEEEFYVG